MLGSASGVAFLPTTDLRRAREFFGDRLGLPVTTQSEYACVLRAGATDLRVTLVDGLRPQPFTVFGWQVVDIHRVVGDLAGAGVALLRYDGLEQDGAGVWTTPGGDRVAWFQDPDGNVLSVTELVAG